MNLINIKTFFENLQPFKNANDIPDIPCVDNNIYEEVIIPNLIRCGAIPKDDLIPNHVYLGSCRNADKACWNGNVFLYERNKFGLSYIEEINHFQDDDGYDVFVPIKEIKEK